MYQNFLFPYRLQQKVVRNLRFEFEQIGFLQIEGTAKKNPNTTILEPLEDRFSVDIDFVKWNGQDIKPVLELTSLMDDIHAAALSHAASLTFKTPSYVSANN